jgi:hypothetical protein
MHGIYPSTQFRFPMGRKGRIAISDVIYAVKRYVAYAPTTEGETNRYNLKLAFRVIRSRLNEGWSIQQATNEVEIFADCFSKI